ncbi:MAG TPA: sigma-70 family RNA polymerase sigma factor [Bryobacteraceae bacterium]|nr:sigma-70 family RNA polymerase sigma factor [Bryobacteraceae bacterium]
MVANALRADTELINRCLCADGEAWEELVRQHANRVYGLCYRYTRRHAEAQELTQDVFLRVFRMLGTFRSDEVSFASWIIRLTRNLLIDNYRRTFDDRATYSIDDQSGMADCLRSAMERPDQALAWRETTDLLQSSLARLSPELREAILVRDLEELNYRETATVLGIPEGTVKSRLNRAHGELARVMKKYRFAV